MSREGQAATWLVQVVECQTGGRSRAQAPDRTNTQGLKITVNDVLPLL